jgi:ADP-ribosylglycohydrolase
MSLNKFESFILGSYLDTIGYLNGFMEFNNINHKSNDYRKSANYTHLINVMEFFKIGGFNINLKLLKASDDTILNIANGKVLIKDKFTINDFIDNYLEYFDTLISERGSGLTIIKSIKNLKKVRSPSVIEYDEKSIGNGATMRACIFGLKYHYIKDLDIMTKWVIETSKLTHNNNEASISSIIVAILTSMSIHKITPLKWVEELNKIKKNIKFKNEKELSIFNNILEKLEYLYNNIGIYNSSFDYDKNINTNRTLIDYTILYNIINPKRYYDNNLHNIGAISEDLIYYAFYTFINSFTINQKSEIQPNFIYLVMNSSLSFGDSDSIGTLCGFWYGGIFGFQDVPNINFKDLEFYKEIKKITDNI